MNSFIYIDGIVLCLCIAVFLMTLLIVVILGCSYLNVVREKERLERENEDLRYELSCAQDRLYKTKFKVPDIDSDYLEILKRSESGVEENG